MKRLIGLVALTALLFSLGCSEKEQSPFSKDWEVFAERFYERGRIVDTGNDDISHSEGQGYGMLFAAVAGDKMRFDEMWRWTRQTLQRSDGLFSWRYRPCPEHNSACVDDPNNATDGDILIAWALLRAAQVWDSQTYRQQAVTILNAIEDKLVVKRHNTLLLLPGEEGFMQSDHVELNLSYWVFPAFNDFYTLTGQPIWQSLQAEGEKLVRQARWGKHKLPTDWMTFSQSKLSPDNSQHTLYGYNACRIPLYLVWQDNFDASSLTPFLAFYDQEVVPATVDVKTGEVAQYSWSAGMEAVAGVVSYRAGQAPRRPAYTLGDEQDYYSASLIMLSELVLLDTQR